MDSSAQVFFDTVWPRTNAEWAELRQGHLPEQFRRAQRKSSVFGLGLLLVVVPCLILVAVSLVFGKYVAAAMVVFLVVAFVLVLTMIERRNNRSVLASRPPLRTVEGWVETQRVWVSFGKGKNHVLSKLTFRDSEESFDLVDALGTHVVSGWVRAYVMVVPTLIVGLRPFTEAVVALEADERTVVEDKEPGLPPPDAATFDAPVD